MPMDTETKRLKKKKVNHDWYMAHREDEIAKATVRQKAKQGDPEFNRSRVEAQRRFAQRHPAKYLLQVASQRAQGRDQECTISLEEVKEMLEPMVCSVTGLPLRWDKSIVRDDFAPSLDQITQGRGYVPGNVRVVCWMYNRVRGEWTDNEVAPRLRLILEGIS
jgi:hypothetical protein